MPKVIFEFPTEEDRDFWMGQYYDGNGEQEMMEAYYQFDKEYPDIKITEED